MTPRQTHWDQDCSIDVDVILTPVTIAHGYDLCYCTMSAKQAYADLHTRKYGTASNQARPFSILYQLNMPDPDPRTGLTATLEQA